ncbi:hypothetical protein QJS10_CPA03g00287 [Acorus calamus]|uniref:Protein SGT1 homolog n=1 Tax=Acorus calamus TaxID=4465 RepID=A0AAV9F8P6_ACOCL|nr:hypothetical protein QJS10_CPA03g00287 [Acorus calamus]
MAQLDLDKRAKEAFVDDNFELALDLYTQALDMDPKNAHLYADRSQANIKLNNFAEAVADANRAIDLDSSISKAYLRKGTACINLEEYQTAKAALEAGALLAQGDSRFTKLIKECEERISAEETNELPKKVTPITLPGTGSDSVNLVTETTKDISSKHEEPTHTAVVAPSKPKYRHDYYNTQTEVVLTIFAKGVPSDNVVIDFGEQILSVTIDMPGEESYHFQPRLFGKIVPENCRYQVLSSKIEIRLLKAEAITWSSLEFSKDKAVPQKAIVSSGVKAEKPAYPSSKSKVDWDKLEAQVKKEEKEEKLEGDAALNKLFRDIYQDADEDTRRAMRKSFIESNGTVLSTNWKEVGEKKVEGSPPEGMELKKWEY